MSLATFHASVDFESFSSFYKAVYTAGVVLPTPVAECRYWHRSLNPKKLVEIGFSRISERMNLARTIKLYKVRGEMGRGLNGARMPKI